MELHEAIRRRAMVRSFSSAAVNPAVVDSIVQAALRAPSAGNTGGTAWVVLEGKEETDRYWDATTDAEWRSRSPRWEGLRRASVVLLAYASAEAYVARYGEDDKADSGLGPAAGEEAWPVPYWTGDAAFGVMSALLAVVDAGLGACILGNFRGEAALAGVLGVPSEWRLFCAVLVGRPDGLDHRSPSLERARPDPSERVHRGSW
ncbi:MAG TPA: nitroreductase family protein [Acidimicrobiales bacterium]|nr:nitroreductase family protein [Acidimicrobiales bacterium]